MKAKKVAANKVLDMRKRAVLQYLSLTDWKMVARLPIPASELVRVRRQLNSTTIT